MKEIPPPPFRTGDIVRLIRGNSPIKVLEVDWFWCNNSASSPKPVHRYGTKRKGWYVRFAYLSSLHHIEEGRKWRHAEDFVLHQMQERENQLKTLYQTKEDNPRFGTFLTKTQNGNIVLEMKGKDGDVESFKPEQIQEVLPYTVEIQRVVGGEGPGEKRHYEMAEGDVEVGDVLLHLSNGNVWEVTKLNTGQRTPSRSSKNGFLKLEGKRLGKEN